MQEGDEIQLLKSAKPTLAEFKNWTKDYFDGSIVFDDKKGYAVFIGRKK